MCSHVVSYELYDLLSSLLLVMLICCWLYVLPGREDPGDARLRHGRVLGLQGFQGYGLSIHRIRYIVPRMRLCVVFSRSAVLRIEGCLISTL